MTLNLTDVGFKVWREGWRWKNQYYDYSEIDVYKRQDSGYGQGQILVNPLHLASIYTSFLNEGNMIKPYLKYKEERCV